MPIDRPEYEAPYAAWQAYCDQLNALKFGNADQMEVGFATIMRQDKHSEELPLFASGFRGVDEDVVIAAVRARYEIWAEACECGVDLKETHPDVWAALATRPLTPEDFNVFPAFADAED